MNNSNLPSYSTSLINHLTGLRANTTGSMVDHHIPTRDANARAVQCAYLSLAIILQPKQITPSVYPWSRADPQHPDWIALSKLETEPTPNRYVRSTANTLDDSYQYSIWIAGNGEPATIHRLTRQDLISWLMWNDPNGCYSDEDNLLEFGRVALNTELIELYKSQVNG